MLKHLHNLEPELLIFSLAVDDLANRVAIPKDMAELIDEVLEHIIYIDLLSHHLG